MIEARQRREQLLTLARSLLLRGEVPTATALAAAAALSLSTYERLVGSLTALLQEAGYVADPTARERLIEAAVALLDEVGLSGLVMDGVAPRAGISHATLYRLFSGKAELLAALARERSLFGNLDAVLEPCLIAPPRNRCPR